MAVRTSLLALQTALFQRLSSDSAVRDLVTGVFDYIPEGTAFPYIRIGEPTVTPQVTKTTFGEQVAVVMHAWSKYPGKKEAYEILNACLAATSRPLRVEGFNLFDQRVDQLQVFDDIDGKTRHGVLRVIFFINN
ncbi:DUF3168 domain-containing protein [Terribacillus saccharophilus]|uniref:DUF3168 domain-containing protein n=1 Tax=Terribacillus saccharophilus TaxID=361277 RepID=A0ABX4H0Z5_9BACI|nr:DUF3168 domain-containing protein [Terribacillus saccharophilus]PAD36325.1 hypothetical protein CHH56_04855 [Terribacillus saccharophilus]PAD95033.1 hypothetical protein CHH50_15630 [Terribacillus saccharophilus]PAE00744.1 hypothetical protein CHH48_05560 [Terribacillus saccharophilus]